jgi:hypothetical protein
MSHYDEIEKALAEGKELRADIRQELEAERAATGTAGLSAETKAELRELRDALLALKQSIRRRSGQSHT